MVKRVITGLVLVSGVVLFSNFSYAEGRGLVGHWKFDEGKGNVAKDSSEKGNDGKIYGAKYVKHGDGYALQFDGKDDYVDCGDDESLKPVRAITIGAWVKFDDLSGNQMIVSYHNSSESGYALWKPSANNLLAVFGDGTEEYFRNMMYGISDTLVEDVWYHIAATFDAHVGRLYINGKEVKNYARTTLIDYKNCDVFRIGERKRIKASHIAPFNGAIDDIRIYNHALTGSEVKKLYDEGKPSIEEDL